MDIFFVVDKVLNGTGVTFTNSKVVLFYDILACSVKYVEFSNMSCHLNETEFGLIDHFCIKLKFLPKINFFEKFQEAEFLVAYLDNTTRFGNFGIGLTYLTNL